MISYSACVFNWMNFCEIQSGAIQPKPRPYLTPRRLYKGIMGIEAAKHVCISPASFHQNGVQGLDSLQLHCNRVNDSLQAGLRNTGFTFNVLKAKRPL